MRPRPVRRLHHALRPSRAPPGEAAGEASRRGQGLTRRRRGTVRMDYLERPVSLAVGKSGGIMGHPRHHHPNG